MSVAALGFSHLTKRYGAASALADVSFRVEPGECFALAGVNGAGKTTLIKCLLDFCEFDAGSIEILGVPHSETRSRQAIVFLPERFTPPFYLTGRNFLAYMMRLHELAYDRPRVTSVLEALDLNPNALAKPVRALSKGMTQKLGLAACLLSRKQLYILDEPLSGLDPRARALAKQQIRQLKSQGRTVFFTSHALADIAELCDRMAILHDGQLRFTGSPDTLCRAYAGADLEQAFLRCIS
jgi:ABC-2 type transport system ATP-binding protein